jgi:hypothetical protein
MKSNKIDKPCVAHKFKEIFHMFEGSRGQYVFSIAESYEAYGGGYIQSVCRVCGFPATVSNTCMCDVREPRDGSGVTS